MEMLLMVLCMSVFGLAVTAIAFGAATRPERAQEAVQADAKPVSIPPSEHFFIDRAPAGDLARPQVPVEALLLQIERHIRLEQAAAESFLEYPTAALLHSRTTSPLVH